MRFVLEPSLEHMALVKVAVSLWNQNDVRALILNLRSSLDRSSFLESLVLFSTEEWNKIVEKVTRKVPKLLIPELLKEKMLSLIKPIGIQLSKWLRFHWIYNLYQNLPAEFCWTPQGTVDGKRTAEVLVKDENLDLSTRYKLACVHCLEDDILEIWNNMHKDLRESFLYHDFSSIVSWTHAMMKNGQFSHSYDFISGANYGTKAATEYFLQKLTQRKKGKILVEAAKFAVKLKADEDVLCSLLSEMDEEQQIKIFEYRPSQILLIFLRWPLQSFFIKIANFVCHLLSKQDFKSLLININLKGHERYKDWDYQKLFRDFWQNSPYAYKSFITRKLNKSSFLKLLFISDKESFRLILKDAPPTEKKKLIYDEEKHFFCYESIRDNNWGFLEFYIRECLPSKKEMLKFKEEFEDDILYAICQKNIQKWNQLFSLSDDSISKLDKRSIEEGESSSSKRFHSPQ